jgi:hypothetical protein
LEFEVNRTKVVEGAVEALAAIECFDRIEDFRCGLSPRGKGRAVNEFVCERVSKRLHGGVVVAIALRLI